MKYMDIIYNIQNYNTYLRLCKKIKSVCGNSIDISMQQCSCEALMDDFKFISTHIIYSEKRENSLNDVVLLELIDQKIIRKDQYEVVNKLQTSISTQDAKYEVEQMLMGKGKTSIITPLSVINYMINRNIHFLKDHTLNQIHQK